MTPRDFRVISAAKIAQIKDERQFQDRLMATQTARLMSIQGRVVEDQIHPDECMAFVWSGPQEPEEPGDRMQKIERYVQARIAAAGKVKPHG